MSGTGLPTLAWQSTFDRLLLCATLALLLWAPFPAGSHTPWASWLLVALVLALWTAWSLLRLVGASWPTHLGRPFAAALLLWFMWLAWVSLQLVEWPAAWLAELSPQRWAHVEAVARFLEEPMPARFSPSLDSAETRQALWLSISYAALFVVLAATLRERRHLRWLLWIVLLSALGQAVYGSVMVMSGLEYGAWGPKEAYRGYATGTFVNRNHFAGYLELGAAAALGLILAHPLARESRRGWRQHLRWGLRRLQDRKLFVRVALVLLFLALILSQSRMGNVAAVAGLCVAVAALLLTRRRGRFALGLLLIASILLIDIWLLGRWFGLEQLAERYAGAAQDAGSRLDLFEAIRPMLPIYSALGSGLGTFAFAFPEFRIPGIPGHVDHAHNDYAQFLIETGVFGSLLLATLAGATAARALLILRRRRDPTAHGVACAGLAALASLAVHSLVDFNLQIPAVAITLVALMAAVWACPTRGSRRVSSPDTA